MSSLKENPEYALKDQGYKYITKNFSTVISKRHK